jgi:hypothetical protein
VPSYASPKLRKIAIGLKGESESTLLLEHLDTSLTRDMLSTPNIISNNILNFGCFDPAPSRHRRFP